MKKTTREQELIILLFWFKSILTIFFLCSLAMGETIASLGSPTITTTVVSTINIESLVEITYQVNQNIAAAKYDLEAAEYAYQEFERDLSQFTPFKFDSNLTRNTNLVTGEPETSTHSYSNTVGFEKEYFNGASFSINVGHQGGFGDEGSYRNPFFDVSATFPLFSSHQTLSRIISQSYEEKQLYSSRLEYVDTILNTIQNAQESYIWLQVYRDWLFLSEKCVVDFQKILATQRTQSNPDEKHQVEGELQTIQSEVVKYQGNVNSGLIGLQSNIGCERLLLSQVEPMELYAKDYYGKAYTQKDERELLAEAERADAEIKILEVSRKAAELKRTLALKGKWDTFLTLSGTYDFSGHGTSSGESGYEADAGVSLQFIDPNLLNISLKKAESEIKKFTAKINSRKLQLKNSIDQDWLRAQNLRGQAEQLFTGVASRRKVFEQKLKDYINGKETVDNLIQARKNLYDSEKNLADVLGDFYEAITQIDRACNVYFQRLNIDIVSTAGQFARKKRS